MEILKTLSAAAMALMLSTRLCSAAVFDFSFTPSQTGGDAITASGTFSTDNTPVDSNVVAVTGIVNGVQISNLDGTGFNIYDVPSNKVDFSFLDMNGIRYSLGNGTNGTDTASSNNGDFSTGTLTVSPDTISSVPLPASAPMFGTALVALGAVGYSLKYKKSCCSD